MLPLLHIWTYLQTQPLLGLTATLCTWELANWIDIRARRSALSNPVVLSILILGAALLLTHTPYKAYFRGAQYVNFLLGPATVALAVPMFNNLPAIRREFVAIVTALTAGSIVAAASAMLIGGGDLAWAKIRHHADCHRHCPESRRPTLADGDMRDFDRNVRQRDLHRAVPMAAGG
jgi:hypothetical protein